VRSHILAAADGIIAVVLDAETIPFIDVTSARMLAALEEQLREQGVRCCSHVTSARSATCCAVQPTITPSLTHVYPSVQAAVDAAQGKTP
jgi:sulfate permease, SulP family